MRLNQNPHISSRTRCFLAALAIPLALTVSSAWAATWYVAPTGSDSNAGTFAAPFASITQAQSVAASGDTVYLRGGTYTNFTIAASDTNYNYVHNITKSGISYLGYPGDPRPVFDFSNVAATLRVCAFLVTGSNNTFQDFDITGVQVGSQGQSECWRLNAGDGNVLRRLVMHDCAGIGVYIQKTASNTLVENCDAYNLIGVSGVSAGNIDGFGCHSSGVGNTFRGCRAWHCSDDGYDCLNAAGAVTFDHCWSYNNGVNGGNANGFKVGGWGCSSGTMPSVIPVHTVKFCLSANNGSHGFYANHQPGQSANWYNNTAYNNQTSDFDMLEGLDNGANCSVSGYREFLYNNLAYVGTVTADDADPASQEVTNSWTNAHAPTDADFQSVDATQMTAPRNADGSLPTIAFMHLASTSPYIDAGTNVGFAFNGAAPDIGCFESDGSVQQPPTAPTGLTATAGNNQVALSWTASGSASSYNVKRATVSGGPYATIASVTAGTSYTDTAAANGTTYYYVVSAVNGSGESANSAEVSATPQAPQPPAAPTGLSATAGKRKISLAWNAVIGATSYNVKRGSTTGGPYSTIATGVTTTTYTNSGLTSRTTYYYVVTAVNANGESAPSNEASATAQ